MNKTVSHIVDGVERRFVIRWSNDHDLQDIHEWLVDEKELGIEGNFLCNWSQIQQCHKNHDLLVLIDKSECIPVVYQFRHLLCSGLLQVRNGWRRKGLGRLLVEECIALALQDEEMVLKVECSPSSSIPFWKSMGFTIIEGKDGKNAKGIRVLTKKLSAPEIGRYILATISSYFDDKDMNADDSEATSFSADSIVDDYGKVNLVERASFPDNFVHENLDLYVEIFLEDELIYRGKAKYSEAQVHGVKKCRNGFYIDSIVR